MKRIIIPIISLLSFTGCVTDLLQQPCYNNSETLVNNSGKDVKIFSYSNTSAYTDNPRNLLLSIDTLLKNQERFSKKMEYCPGGEVGRINFSSFIGCDSIVFDYGDKVQSYSALFGNEVRNPYRLDANEIRTSKKGSNFVYTLTPDDYANATPKP